MVKGEKGSSDISNPVAAAFAVPPWLIAVLSFVGGIILGWFKGVAAKGISGMLGMAAMSGFKGFVMTAPDRAVEWMKLAAEAFSVPSSAWATFVSETMYQLTGGYVDPTQFIGLGVGPGSRGAIEALGEAYLTPMMGLILPRAGETSTQMGLTPEDGLNAAERFFGVNLEFQMKAWLLHLLGDTFSFGMWKAMKDLPNAISWSFGIGWLSWLVMGTPFRMGIADPLEILYNRMYRPYRLSIAKLADAFWRGLISQPQFYSGMKDFGVLDPQMPIIMEMERTKITDAQAYKLYRMGKMGFGDLVDHQRAQGHSPEESSVLAAEMTRREVGDLLVDVAKTATKHYKDRRMSGSELRGFLREAGWTDEEAGIIIQDLNMQMALEAPEEIKERTLTPANIGWLYQHQKRTRQWAETKLTAYGFKVSEIPDFLELYQPKVEKPPEPREPPAGLVGWLFQRGMIPLEEARSRWADLELTPDYVALLAMRYAPPVPPPPPPPREFSPTEVGRLYREHAMVWDEAMRRLSIEPIRMRLEDAEMYLETFYFPIEAVEPPPREAPASVAGILYQEGKIPLALFEEYLETLRYSPTSKEFLTLHYEPPVPPPPPLPREFSPTEIGRLFSDASITPRDAVDRLTGPQVRMTRDDSIIYLRAFYIPIEAMDIGVSYNTGVLSRQEAIVALITLLPGLLEVDAIYYLDTFFT